MVGLEMNELKKIGLGLTGFGVFFLFFGVIFFFDKGLLAVGNLLTKGQFYSVLTQILFVSGVMTTIGVQSSLQFFTKRGNFKPLLVGLVKSLVHWAFGVDIRRHGPGPV
ncbi:hypothetical protein HanHA300_Chr06g0199131 [Helianthus annuus]|nr:hypothetical protein HanHA300_Chr06g0199131 [Helianthus annuus]KAJ0739659.1 hypothetical protein HanOQP8_Chr06g0208171 [Helianthus annuus]